MLVSTCITLFTRSFGFNFFVPQRHILGLVVVFSKLVSSSNAYANTHFGAVSGQEKKLFFHQQFFCSSYHLLAQFYKCFVELISRYVLVLLLLQGALYPYFLRHKYKNYRTWDHALSCKQQCDNNISLHCCLNSKSLMLIV